MATTPTHVRDMSPEAYARARRALIAGAAPTPTAQTTPPAPVSATDRPDNQCTDVRALSQADYLNRKAELIGRRST